MKFHLIMTIKKILNLVCWLSKSISYNMYQKNYDVQRYDYFSDFDKYKRVSNGKSDNPIYNDERR